jgi:diguanylate cyclase
MIIWLPIFWMAAGICLFAGAHFVHTGRSREHEQLYLAFGALSLIVAGYMVVTALMQDPNIRLSARTLERAHLTVACLVYPVAVWFLALYSRMRHWRSTVLVVSGVFAVLMTINFFRPYSLLYSRIRDMPPLVLPWGESIRQFGGPATMGALIYYICTIFVFLWAFWRCSALWTQGDRRRAWPLLVYLILQLAAVLHTEYFTYTNQRALEWDALPFLGLILLLSRSLTLELRKYAEDLGDSNRALRKENEARTLAQTHLRHAAYHDALTGLLNRRSLREHIDEDRLHAGDALGALVVIDPDRFRIINQALGHRMGDQLIREMGRRLVGSGKTPRHVARLDGDEFAVLIEGLPSDREQAVVRARAVAERICTELASGIQLGSHDLTTDVSAGVTLVHRDADSEALLREAYMALQAAKKHARDRVAVYTRDMKTGAERSLRLENDLRLAIERDALHLKFQPQVDASGKLVGAEALLRWEHPEFGAIHPEEFVRLAEDRGLIQSLGRLALRKACDALSELDVSDNRFRMAINISPWQLFLADFPDMVQQTLLDEHIAPEQITLEITESVFMHDVADAVQKIRTLSARGIRVAIDDFGTGFASIALLKGLPLDEVKIDQSFVHGMDTSGPDRFVAAVIALGRSLDLKVVAEGVETDDQRRNLADMGCNIFQGYLISRPMDLADLKGRLGEALPG